jgi:hypothetical protein
MYSIQPGSAYLPISNGNLVTGFSTDPSYTDTDATLIKYTKSHTCA